MQRFVAFAVVSVFAFSTASAGPLDLRPNQQTAPSFGSIFAEPAAPAQPVNMQEPNMGGGFLEMLFRGPPGQNAAAPRYEPNPIVMPEPRGYRVDPSQEQPEYLQPARPSRAEVSPRFMKQEVSYSGKEKPGTVIINTNERLLYLVLEDGKALRYGIGVGRPGFTWAGVHHISNKREWPDWTPPAEMIKRRPDLPRHMEGGPDNPLGARAMYLGSTLYRIHGSNEPWTIGQAVSSGCIRMRNEDVVDLYGKVKVGTKVVVI